MMIPLVRPSLPDPYRFIPIWKAATERTGIYSNFGECFLAASELLSALTQKLAIPCSSGTEAVTLAAFASQRQHGEKSCYVEAFTFEAGRIAAERLEQRHMLMDWGMTQVRSDHPQRNRVVIRTVPFGRHRSFQSFVNEGEYTVIDAAGGFGPGIYTGLNVPIAVSFHATKNFPIGEGGAVLLPQDWTETYDVVRSAMNFGFDAARVRTNQHAYASNGKIDELRAAMLITQLSRAEYFAGRSSRIRQQTIGACRHLNLDLPYRLGDWQSLVVLQVPDAGLMHDRLKRAGIATRRVYEPVPRQDMLTPDERNLLAVPSDCESDEFEQVIETMRGAL